MIGKRLFDTCILVYAYDDTEKEKHSVCRRLVELVFRGEERGTVSLQVLAELFFVLTEKMKAPLSPQTAAEIVTLFLTSGRWEIIHYSTDTLRHAMDTVAHEKTPWWDTVIAETMKEHKIQVVVTENEQDFTHTGVRILNPFTRKSTT